MNVDETVRTYSQDYKKLRRYLKNSVYKNKTFPRIIESRYRVVNNRQKVSLTVDSQWPTVPHKRSQLVTGNNSYSQHSYKERNGLHKNVPGKNSLPPTRENYTTVKDRGSKSAPAKKEDDHPLLPRINKLVIKDVAGVSTHSRNTHYTRTDKFATSWAAARAENEAIMPMSSAKDRWSERESSQKPWIEHQQIQDDSSALEESTRDSGYTDVSGTIASPKGSYPDQNQLETPHLIHKTLSDNDEVTGPLDEQDESVAMACEQTDYKHINTQENIKVANKTNTSKRVPLQKPIQRHKSEFIEKVWERVNENNDGKFIVKTQIKKNLSNDIDYDRMDTRLLERNLLDTKYVPNKRNAGYIKTERNNAETKNRHKELFGTTPAHTYTTEMTKTVDKIHKSPVYIRAKTKQSINLDRDDESARAPLLNNPKYLVYLYSNTATEAQIRLRELLNKTNDSATSTTSCTSNDGKKNSRILSKRETTMYIHLTNVYANTNSQRKRQDRFIEQLEQRQDEIEKRLQQDKQKVQSQEQHAKHRGYIQLKSVRDKFEREQTKRFRTQYITSKVLEHEYESRHLYGLPEHINKVAMSQSQPSPQCNKSNGTVDKNKRRKKNLEIYGMASSASKMPTSQTRGKPPLLDGIDVVKVKVKDDTGAKVHSRKVLVKNVLDEARQLIQDSPLTSPTSGLPTTGNLMKCESLTSLSTMDRDDASDIFERVRQKYDLDVSSDEDI